MPGHELGMLEALGLNDRDLQSAVEHVDVDVGLSDLDYDDNPCIVLVNNINNMTDLFVVIFFVTLLQFSFLFGRLTQVEVSQRISAELYPGTGSVRKF